MGAELDSLADFLNFGVAAPLTLYFWALQDMRGLGWISVLVFAVCCVIRLARFNVTAKSDEPRDSAFSRACPRPPGRCWSCCRCICPLRSPTGRSCRTR